MKCAYSFFSFTICLALWLQQVVIEVYRREFPFIVFFHYILSTCEHVPLICSNTGTRFLKIKHFCFSLSPADLFFHPDFWYELRKQKQCFLQKVTTILLARFLFRHIFYQTTSSYCVLSYLVLLSKKERRLLPYLLWLVLEHQQSYSITQHPALKQQQCRPPRVTACNKKNKNLGALLRILLITLCEHTCRGTTVAVSSLGNIYVHMK